jgi:hypothetical protein
MALTPNGYFNLIEGPLNLIIDPLQAFQTEVDALVNVLTGGTGSLVTSVFGRVGAVTAQTGDYSFSQISGSLPLAQIASVSTQTILGRNSGGSGAVEVLTPTTAKTILALNNVTNDAQVKRTEMGVALGVATLDASTKIPDAQLSANVPLLNNSTNSFTGTMGLWGATATATNGLTITKTGLAVGGFGIDASVSGSADADVSWVGGKFASSWSGSGSSFHATLVGVYGATAHTGSGRVDSASAVIGEAIHQGTGHIEQPFGSWNSVAITGAGTVGAAVGTFSRVFVFGNNAGPMTSSNPSAMFHGQFWSTAGATGTFSAIAGLRLSGWIKSGGPVTTSYGIYIDTSIDIGTTRYAFYSLSTSPSLFSGDITGTGLGLGTAPTAQIPFKILKTLNNSTAVFGGQIDVTNTASGAFQGITGFQVKATNAVSSSGFVTGIQTTATTNAGQSAIVHTAIDITNVVAGSPSSVYGVFHQTQLAAGSSVNNTYGLFNDIAYFTSGVSAFAYGVYTKFRGFGTITGGVGTAIAYYAGAWGTTGITNGYGLYIDSTSVDRATGTKYAIYSLAVAPSLLSGNLTISGLLRTGTTPVTLTTAAGKIVLTSIDVSTLTPHKVLKTDGSTITETNAIDNGAQFTVGLGTTILSADYLSGVASFGGMNADGFLCDNGMSYLGDWNGLGNVTYLLADDNAATTYMVAGGASLSFDGAGLAVNNTLTITTVGNLTLGPTGNLILSTSGKHIDPSVNYDQNLGQLSKKYLTLHAAELWVETLVAQNTIATIGGRILVGPTTVLTSDLGTGTTSIIVKHNQMVSGDRVYMEANGSVEFMAITSGPSGVGPYTYTVTRNLDGSGANQWYAGDAVFNTGQTGAGFIDLYSVRGVKSAGQTGPTIVGNIRNSATYNDWSEHWAIGNLNGLYGYGSNTPGVGLGQYAANLFHATLDATFGLRFYTGTATLIGQWSPTGGITVGQVAALQSNIVISSGALDLRVNTAIRTHLATDGSGYFANTAFSFDTSGNVTITGNAVIGGVTIGNGKMYVGTGTFNNTNTGFYVDSAGQFSLKNKLSWNGTTLTIDGGGTFSGALSAATGSFSGSVTASSGAIGGLTIAATKVYVGTGTFNNTNTAFYVDNTGQFSLKNKLSWDLTTLVIDGSGIVTGTISAAALKIGNFNNLAENPGFETGDSSGWTLGIGMTVSAGSSRSGAYFLNALSASQTTLNNIYVSCAPGDILYCEGYVWTTGGSNAQVVIAWYDATKAFLSYSTGNGVAGTAWQKSSILGTAPANAVYARCGFQTSAGTAGWLFDDIYFRFGAISGWTMDATSFSSTGVKMTSGATAALAFGATVPTSATVGTGLYVDATGLYGLVSSAQTFSLVTSTGIFKIGSNVSAAATTALVVFGTAPSPNYNGESLSAGDLLIGDNSSSKANVRWNKTAGKLEFRGGTTVKAYVDTTGAIMAGSGNMALDDNGISVISTTSFAVTRAYKNVVALAGNTLSSFHDILVASSDHVSYIETYPITGRHSSSWLYCRAPSGKDSNIVLSAVVGSDEKAQISLGNTNGLRISTMNAAGGNATLRMSVDTDGNIVLGSGSAALLTSATNGFVYLPTCAGTPSGVPTAKTGMVAHLYDTTNNKLWVYNGAWKSVVLT